METIEEEEEAHDGSLKAKVSLKEPPSILSPEVQAQVEVMFQKREVLQVGKLDNSRKFSLAKLLASRPDKSIIETRFKHTDEEKENMYNRKLKLGQMLLNRPSLQKLEQMNVMKPSASSQLAGAKQQLERQQTKDRLSALMQSRPNHEVLEKKHILLTPALAREDHNRVLQAKSSLSSLIAARPSPSQLLGKKIISDAGDLARLHPARAADYQLTPVTPEVLKNIKVQQVACGWGHTAVVDANGVLYTFGSSGSGRLGLGEVKQSEVSEPQANATLSGLGKVTFVSCGDNHTLAICGGHAYTWGQGTWGRLGLGTQDDVSVPTKVDLGDEAAVSGACGSYHTLMLTKSGAVYGFGWNAQGRLGLGKGDASLAVMTPTKLATFGTSLRATALAAGQGASFAVTEDGRLYSWGVGAFGVLGHGSEEDVWEPTPVSSLKEQAVAAVACGATQALVLTGSGSLLALGQLALKQLVKPDQRSASCLPRAVSVPGCASVDGAACGKNHCAVTSGGRVFTWGNGGKGVLGHGNEDPLAEPVQVRGLDNVSAVSCGWSHSAVLLSDGRLAVFGSKQDGKLGL